MKSGSLNLLEPSGPVQGCNGTALPFTFLINSVLLLLYLKNAFRHQNFQSLWLNWIHMTQKYTWGRTDNTWHSMWQWQNWWGRQKDVATNYTWTIFLTLNYLWLGEEKDLLLWDCQAEQERHAIRPKTDDNKTENGRHSRKNQGWLDGNTVAGQET